MRYSDRSPSSHEGNTIAFCGTRGVPANYGGFETAVDEISKRFVAHGYDVEVICRVSSVEPLQSENQGRRLAFVEGSAARKLDTVVSSIQTGVHLLRNRRRYRHVFWFNNANLPGILMTRLAGIPMSVNTDGLEWRRAKWSLPFKLYYMLAAALVCLVCSRLVSDSLAMQSYYRERFGKKTFFIPYGHPAVEHPTPIEASEILARYGLSPGGYFLQITRFEPDNLPLAIAQGFLASSAIAAGKQLVVVGLKDETPYACALKALDGESVKILPANYNPLVLQVLREHCFAYLHGNSVGGTNPALLEAMTACPRVLAIAGPFSSEVLGDTGYYFTPEALPDAFNTVLDAPDRRQDLFARVTARYQWEAVAQAYMTLGDTGTTDYSASLKPAELKEASPS